MALFGKNKKDKKEQKRLNEEIQLEESATGNNETDDTSGEKRGLFGRKKDKKNKNTAEESVSTEVEEDTLDSDSENESPEEASETSEEPEEANEDVLTEEMEKAEEKEPEASEEAETEDEPEEIEETEDVKPAEDDENDQSETNDTPAETSEPEEEGEGESVPDAQDEDDQEPEAKKGGFFSKLKAGLTKTRGGLLGNLFRSEDRIDDDFYDTLEEALIMADVGMETTEELIEKLRDRVHDDGLKTIPEAREVMIEIMTDAMTPEVPFALEEGRRAVLLIVGVNGVGKTTTIGKLAHYYKESGLSIVLAAADTFRAAAAEQLTEWANRADVQIVKHGEGADPAAVVFDAMASYKARGREVLICDTAGRLHNKKNLMDELSKIRRVISRELEDVPVETLLVLDATTGQNAIKQAEAFSEATGLTGLVLTKLDGTAKGGVALAVKKSLNLPIRFIGVGEGMEDMHPFSAEDFARALI